MVVSLWLCHALMTGSTFIMDIPNIFSNIFNANSSRARTVNFHLFIYSSRLCVACNEKLSSRARTVNFLISSFYLQF